MKTPSLFLRLLCVYFAVWLAVPASNFAQTAFTISSPTFPTNGIVRLVLNGLLTNSISTIDYTPRLVTNGADWISYSTGTVGQSEFNLNRPTSSVAFFRARSTLPLIPPTVATPTFTPGGGLYATPTNVTITCATASAAIYYTTNGATPTPLDTFIYNGASVYLNCSVTLKARAFRPNYNDSLVAAAMYSINCPPVVGAGPQQIIASPSTTLQGGVTDDGLPLIPGMVAQTWSKITGPGTVTFGNANQTNSSASFSANGIYTLKLMASDGQYTNSAQVTIAVNPTLAVSLVEPANLTTVFVPTNLLLRAEASCTSGSVTQVVFYANGAVIGTATNAEFSFYWRSVPLGTNNLMAVAFSSDAANASLSSTNPVSLIVNWPTDIGRVTLAETDISIPTAGLPLALNRLYDSRRGTNGSFGANARMDIEDIRIRKSDLLSGGYLAVTQLGQDYIRVNHSTVVTVSLGGGEEYQFAPHLVFQSGGLDHVGHTTVNYTLPVRWVFDSLTGRGALASVDSSADAGMLNNNTVNGTWSGAVDVAVCDPTCSSWTADEPSFSAFTFTAPDGTRYTFNSSGGLYQKIDRNGNTLTFDTTGITWSNPNVGLTKQLGFMRDGNNRITQVFDPVAPSPTGPPALTYAYDAIGNLTNMARLIQRSPAVYENTGYAYTNTAYSNAITAITDPRGVTSQRYEYDGGGRLTKQTDALGRFSSHTYDTANRRQTMIDRLGNTTVQTFTPAGQLASVSDASGAVTSYLYDGEGRRIAEINPLGLTNTFAYDSQDNLLASTNEVGAATSATYNEFGQVLTTADARNAGTTNEYDGNGNLISVTNAMGVVSGFGYNALGERTAETNALSLPEQTIVLNDYNEFGWLTNNSTALNAASYTHDDNGNRMTELRVRTLPGGGTESVLKQWNYDAANRVTVTIDPLGGTNRTSYNGLGKAAFTVDALNRTNRFGYDAVGLLTNTVFADGLNERSAYDAEGRRTSSVDRAGRATTYTYDALGRLARTTFPDTSYSQNTYDVAGRLQNSAQAPVPGGFGPPADSLVTTYGYDAAGRRTSVINELDQTNRFAYDANGNQTNVVDALGRTNHYEFDALNRPTKMIFPDGTSESTGYDALDRKATVTNQADVVTRFGYDALGRLTSVTNAFDTAEQLVTRYAYDELGNLLRQIDGLNRTNRFEYDALGRRTKETLPQNQSQSFGYDAVGNLRYQTNFTGTIITNQFDALNRLTNKASAGGYKVTFAYSATGTRTNMTDASGTTSYTYNTRDRLTAKATPQGTLNYAYEPYGNLQSITSTTSNGVSLGYTYDALNRVTNVAQTSATVASYAFDSVGNLQTARLANAVTNTYTYNALNRLTNITAKSASGTIASFAYKLAAAGNRTNLLESVNGSARTNVWGYDALYRLTNETITGTSPTGTISYQYDLVGNRTNRTSSVSGVTNQTFTYSSNDWLTTDAYDSNGNTRTNNGNTYAYDAENRLTNSVTTGTNVTMLYNGDGIRVAKTVGTTTTLYLVDDRNPTGYAQVLEEKTVSGGTTNLSKVFTYGLDLISQRQVASGTTHYYGYDGNGNVRFLTATNATISDTYAYEAFGTVIASTGTTPNDYRYSGEQYDPNLGFTYLRARYLNPNTGRFLSRDSHAGNIFDPPSLHRYTYCANNPANCIDPSGRDSLGDVLTSIAVRVYLAAQTFAPYIRAIRIAAGVATAVLFVADREFRGLLVSAGFNPVSETALVVGELRALTSTATKSVTTLGELDVVIGFVRDNKTVQMAKLGDNFATAMSHERLAQQAQVFVESGKLQEGVEAFTVVKQNGQIIIRGSNNFNEEVSESARAFIESLFQ